MTMPQNELLSLIEANDGLIIDSSPASQGDYELIKLIRI